MQDVWIALDARTRRMNWLWADLMGLVFAGSCVAIYLTQRDHHASAAERWSWPAAFGAIGLAMCVCVVVRGYGRTELSRDGMQFRFFFTRRFIAWEEITQIEKHSHAMRRGTYWDIRVHLANGRKRHVPGAFTLNSRRTALRVLDEKLETMQCYWTAAGQNHQLR